MTIQIRIAWVGAFALIFSVVCVLFLSFSAIAKADTPVACPDPTNASPTTNGAALAATVSLAPSGSVLDLPAGCLYQVETPISIPPVTIMGIPYTITINGNGDTINGGGVTRIFNLGSIATDAFGSLTLNNTNLTNGSATTELEDLGNGGPVAAVGGAVFVPGGDTTTVGAATFTMNGGSITDSSATSSTNFAEGGAIGGDGIVNINGVTFARDSASGAASQSGTLSVGSPGDSYGGAIAVRGAAPDNLTVTGSTFVDNSAGNTSDTNGSEGTGGAIFVGGTVGETTPATITNTKFIGNTVTAPDIDPDVAGGGAIADFAAVPPANFNQPAGTILTITSSSFSHNRVTETAQGFGGAVEAQGGGPNSLATLAITQSSFDSNTAADGGALGIFSDTLATMSQDTLSNNSAPDGAGGAIGTYGYDAADQATLNIFSSTLAGNSAWQGAAVDAEGFTLSTIANSTVTNNSIQNGAPVDYNQAAIDNYGSLAVNLINDTVASNPSIGVMAGTGPVTLTNTIVANNALPSDPYSAFATQVGNSPTNGNCTWFTVNGTDASATTALGTLTNGGNNLEDANSARNDTCDSSGSNPVPKGNPNLGPLASNGGPTQTMALLPGSAAIGGGNATVCAMPPVNGVDQRGVLRGSPCDIGAFEVQASSIPVTPVVPVKGRVRVKELTACFIHREDLRVKGREIREVKETIAGHTKIFKLHATSKNQTLTLKVKIPASAGNHVKATIRVLFAAGSGPAKTVHETLNRCAPHKPPRFTG